MNEKSGNASNLMTVVVASVLASLDLFVVNLAFSSISASFPKASLPALSWVLNAYGITFAALLVPSGRLADRFGRKRLFRLGLVIFAVSSTAAALAPNVWTLIIARAVQGGGAALLVPTSLALLLAAYPKEQHKRMVSIWAASGSVAAAAGPMLGGLLTQASWRWIFLINLPIALPAILRSARLEETHRSDARIPDLFGSALLVIGAGALTTVISYATEWGFSNRWFQTLLVVSVLALIWFVHRCRTNASPAMNLGVFQIPSFTIATIGMACFYLGFAIMLLGCSLFITRVWAWSPVLAGLAFAFGPATGCVTALAVGKTGLPPRRLAIIGGILLAAAGVLWMFNLGAEVQFLTVFLPGVMLIGGAAGTAQTGFLAGGTAELPAHEYAAGSGVLNTARQIGSAIGVAVLVALVGASRDAAHYRIAWGVMAAAGLVAAFSGLLLRSKARPASELVLQPVLD